MSGTASISGLIRLQALIRGVLVRNKIIISIRDIYTKFYADEQQLLAGTIENGGARNDMQYDLFYGSNQLLSPRHHDFCLRSTADLEMELKYVMQGLK